MNKHVKKLKKMMDDMFDDYVVRLTAIGEELSKMKALVGHGKYTEGLEELNLSQSQARKYITIYEGKALLSKRPSTSVLPKSIDKLVDIIKEDKFLQEVWGGDKEKKDTFHRELVEKREEKDFLIEKQDDMVSEWQRAAYVIWIKDNPEPPEPEKRGDRIHIELQSTATDLKAMYRKASKALHPDVTKDDGTLQATLTEVYKLLLPTAIYAEYTATHRQWEQLWEDIVDAHHSTIGWAITAKGLGAFGQQRNDYWSYNMTSG